MRPTHVNRGMFVSFEGVEAVGKSTAIQIAGAILKDRGVPWISTREPGGTPLAEALRELVLGSHQESVTDVSELLMMFAARAQSVAEIIRPALAAGQWVLCDRFTDATLAYQGAGRGFDSHKSPCTQSASIRILSLSKPR
ncbi:MAG: dTMP kinase, partial [Pseudomonadota bacterium]